MPKVSANGITINYAVQGTGDPLVLIPFLTADHACYTFQVEAYAKHFTCISLDPRGAGETDSPTGVYSMELFADDVAAFMQAIGVDRAHIAGLSLGAAVGMWLAAKYPARVRSLSLHSGMAKADPFLRTVVQGWQIMAKALGSVPDTVQAGIFPWCFTPELYAEKPEYIESLAAFIRQRPAQTVNAFMQQSDAIMAHDAEAQLGRISAPTQLTFGRYDMLTSTRFADQLKAGIAGAELVVFDGAAHAAIFEQVDEFNRQTLAFLQRH